MTARCDRPVRWLAWLMAALSVWGLSACHTAKKATVSNVPIADRSQKIDDPWASLDIKLSPRDNASLYAELKTWLGAPYLYGGNTRQGVDCSGLVVEVFMTVYHIRLQRNSARILERNCRKIAKEQLDESDLVFFVTNGSGRINHVGIYLKDRKFVHASSRGVRVDDLTDSYYAKHFAAAGRVLR